MEKFKKMLLRGTPSMLLPLGAGFVMASSADLRAADLHCQHPELEETCHALLILCYKKSTDT